MNFFGIILRACFGFRSYAELLNVPYRVALKYLAQLVALLAATLAAVYLPAMLSRLPEIAKFVDQDFPRFTIYRGAAVLTEADAKANANWSSRYVRLDLPGASPMSAGNDGSATAALAAAARPAVIIQSDKIVVQNHVLDNFIAWLVLGRPFDWRKPDKASAEAPFAVEFPTALLPGGPFNGSYVQHYLRSVIPTAAVLLGLMAFVCCLAQTHLLATFGSMFEPHWEARLSYWQLLNLATFAITPAAILVTIYAALGLEGLPLPLIYLVAHGIFFIGSAHCCRPRKEEAAVDDSEFY